MFCQYLVDIDRTHIPRDRRPILDRFPPSLDFEDRLRRVESHTRGQFDGHIAI